MEFYCGRKSHFILASPALLFFLDLSIVSILFKLLCNCILKGIILGSAGFTGRGVRKVNGRL